MVLVKEKLGQIMGEGWEPPSQPGSQPASQGYFGVKTPPLPYPCPPKQEMQLFIFFF